MARRIGGTAAVTRRAVRGPGSGRLPADSPEFLERYRDQLRRIVARLAADSSPDPEKVFRQVALTLMVVDT
jgi:hypothetical protein